MPNLDFYAVDDDQAAVLNALFDLGMFRVFEAYSQPGNKLQEFHGTTEIPEDPHGSFVMLYTLGSGPEPMADRVDVRPGTHGDATFRYRCLGWGLIGLHLGNHFEDRELRSSHTNHNTEKRAMKWAEALPDMGDPAAWDFPAVTKASGRLNRVIRGMAIHKIGSRPVLPLAAQLIAEAGLIHEYGVGLHASPSPGMMSRAAQPMP